MCSMKCKSCSWFCTFYRLSNFKLNSFQLIWQIWDLQWNNGTENKLSLYSEAISYGAHFKVQLMLNPFDQSQFWRSVGIHLPNSIVYDSNFGPNHRIWNWTQPPTHKQCPPQIFLTIPALPPLDKQFCQPLHCFPSTLKLFYSLCNFWHWPVTDWTNLPSDTYLQFIHQKIFRLQGGKKAKLDSLLNKRSVRHQSA